MSAGESSPGKQEQRPSLQPPYCAFPDFVEAELARVSAGDGLRLLAFGGRGIGKSSLLYWLERELAKQGRPVFRASGRRSPAGVPMPAEPSCILIDDVDHMDGRQASSSINKLFAETADGGHWVAMTATISLNDLCSRWRLDDSSALALRCRNELLVPVAQIPSVHLRIADDLASYRDALSSDRGLQHLPSWGTAMLSAAGGHPSVVGQLATAVTSPVRKDAPDALAEQAQLLSRYLAQVGMPAVERAVRDLRKSGTLAQLPPNWQPGKTAGADLAPQAELELLRSGLAWSDWSEAGQPRMLDGEPGRYLRKCADAEQVLAQRRVAAAELAVGSPTGGKSIFLEGDRAKLILALAAAHPGVASRADLAAALGYQGQSAHIRLQALLQRLRDDLADAEIPRDTIESVHGKGYRLAKDATARAAS